MLKADTFSEGMEKFKVKPIMKPGNEGTTDPSKYRPIRLINVGRKVLEKKFNEHN